MGTTHLFCSDPAPPPPNASGDGGPYEDRFAGTTLSSSNLRLLEESGRGTTGYAFRGGGMGPTATNGCADDEAFCPDTAHASVPSCGSCLLALAARPVNTLGSRGRRHRHTPQNSRHSSSSAPPPAPAAMMTVWETPGDARAGAGTEEEGVGDAVLPAVVDETAVTVLTAVLDAAAVTVLTAVPLDAAVPVEGGVADSDTWVAETLEVLVKLGVDDPVSEEVGVGGRVPDPVDVYELETEDDDVAAGVMVVVGEVDGVGVDEVVDEDVRVRAGVTDGDRSPTPDPGTVTRKPVVFATNEGGGAEVDTPAAAATDWRRDVFHIADGVTPRAKNVTSASPDRIVAALTDPPCTVKGRGSENTDTKMFISKPSSGNEEGEGVEVRLNVGAVDTEPVREEVRVEARVAVVVAVEEGVRAPVPVTVDTEVPLPVPAGEAEGDRGTVGKGVTVAVVLGVGSMHGTVPVHPLQKYPYGQQPPPLLAPQKKPVVLQHAAQLEQQGSPGVHTQVLQSTIVRSFRASPGGSPSCSSDACTSARRARVDETCGVTRRTETL